MSNSNLGEALSRATPKGVSFILRRISTSPTTCPAIFSAPPDDVPEATRCESHFFTVSIESTTSETEGSESSELLSFGIEILIYTTDRLTILFVSKADSTGCLQKLKLPPGEKSLIRNITTTLVSSLVETHQRPGVRLVVSLFARAQNQYLFPGSVENKGKHVLDDRGLVKWWCRVFDPVLRGYEQESHTQDKGLLDKRIETTTTTASAYLIVPGCDKFETRSFFPATAKLDTAEHLRWINSYPLSQICKTPTAPPRCLVPRFPDDPKARFLIDLDDEIPDEENEAGEANKPSTGQWRSIRSLEQFWEMMAFRQECSAGRLVGFLWMIINPPGLINTDEMADKCTRDEVPTAPKLGTVEAKDTTTSDGPPVETGTKDTSQTAEQLSAADSTEAAEKPNSRQQSEPEPPSTNPTEVKEQERTEGVALVDEKVYKVVTDILAEQDFATEEETETSTKEWVEKVSELLGREDWSQKITGKKEPSAKKDDAPAVNNLISGGLVRKRKGAGESGEDGATAGNHDESVTTLPVGLIRKKGDKGKDSTKDSLATAEAETASQSVNVLNTNLVRKKKKT
ncbi:hypothetical protein FQN54_005344 [Arachnomyces sp. PD_36]|nr:hypothetical protein FQN54_005344 [Arachnomyces sp. PD_36]